MSSSYGTWKSPIDGASIASGVSLRDVQWDNASDTLVWWESRGPQGVLLAQQGADAARELTDRRHNVAGRVGYGGGAFTVAGGKVFFVANARLFSIDLRGGDPVSLTPAFGSAAAPAISPDGDWLVFVHSYEGVDGLTLVDTAGKTFPQKLAYGSDFVMQPTWHPRGNIIAAITWNHPQMPWNGSELRLLRLGRDARDIPYLQANEHIAGDKETAIFQPQFSPDGRSLAYISDASGWGQLTLYDLETQSQRQLTSAEAEHGKPAWVQGMRSFAWTADSRALIARRNQRGSSSLLRVDIASGDCEALPGWERYTHLEQPAVSVHNGAVACIASSTVIPPRIVSANHAGKARIHRRRGPENLPPASLSSARDITWQGDDGDIVHGLFYPPAPSAESPPGLPPLIVDVHGGPTSQRSAAFSSEVQFFTTRGYAVLQVNHRGSTGYGKAYMDMHRGNWGVYDVADCLAGLRHIAQQELADTKKAVIMGGSAGGFTVLQSLARHPGVYCAGICSYGVSNQFSLLMDTHKFEARYSYWLLGELPSAAETYRERSPLLYADCIVDPVILFQGTEDKVVPQDQSDSIAASLRRRGIPHEYHIFEGEGHGWRKPETIEIFYQKMERFLLQHVIYA